MIKSDTGFSSKEFTEMGHGTWKEETGVSFYRNIHAGIIVIMKVLLVFFNLIIIKKISRVIFMVEWTHVGCGVHRRAMILERLRRTPGDEVMGSTWGQAFVLYVTCIMCQAPQNFYGYGGDNIPVWKAFRFFFVISTVRFIWTLQPFPSTSLY